LNDPLQIVADDPNPDRNVHNEGLGQVRWRSLPLGRYFGRGLIRRAGGPLKIAVAHLWIGIHGWHQQRLTVWRACMGGQASGSRKIEGYQS
jgi:hypothetical protein